MDMNQLMEQARKMQEQLAVAQDGLADIKVKSSAGGGMVKVTASADMKLVDLTIDPQAVDPSDVEMLQDMILAAVNDALGKAEQAASNQFGSAAQGMNIPGLF